MDRVSSTSSASGSAAASTRGFSLIELMIAVAIIGMVLLVGALVMGGQNDARTLRRVVQDFSEVIRSARDQAVRENVAMLVSVRTSATDGGGVNGRLAYWGVNRLDGPTCQEFFTESGHRVEVNEDPRYRNVTISNILPRVPGSTLLLCIRPNGRIYEWLTGDVHPPIEEFGLSGQILVEFVNLQCPAEGNCERGGFSRTVSIGHNGRVDIMPAGFVPPDG